MQLARRTFEPEKPGKRRRLKDGVVVPVCFILGITLLAPTVYYVSHYRSSAAIGDCNVLTVLPSGQLVHQIREYMSLYAVWKLHERELAAYKVQPYIMEYMKQGLLDVFTGASIPVLSPKCGEVIHDVVQRFDSSSDFRVGPFRNVRYCLGSFSFRYKDIVDYGVANIRKELQFRPELIRSVTELFEDIRNSTKAKTVVCMHFSGGEYSSYLRASYKSFKREPDFDYYVNAMEYYKNKFENVAFVLLTVQTEWLKKNQATIARNNIVRVNPFKAGDQVSAFALLSSCNHTVMSYGSFATTAAMLSGGEVIVYDVFSDERPLEKLMEGLGVAKYFASGGWLVGNETHIGPYGDFH